MLGLSNFILAIWSLNVGLQVFVVVLLLVHRSWRSYPAFLYYLVANLLQGCLAYVIYSHYGSSSIWAKRVYWSTQIPISAIRAWIVVALWHHILGAYRGIWALAWRVFAVLAGILLALSIVFSGLHLDYGVVLRADRALALTTVILLVALFVFARLYGIAVPQTVRLVSIGFLLYLSFNVLNDQLGEHLLWPYANVWRVLNMLSFTASAVLWAWAFLKPAETPAKHLFLLPRDIYYSLTPELNRRLRVVNERLSRIWDPEENRS